jgi:uncharacterized membrane protein YphA (DoxX/SURF4 family)
VVARRLGEAAVAGLDGRRQGPPGGFVKGAIAASNEPEHPQVAYGWWVNFLGWVSDNASWMARLVAVGETTIGICLTLGLFTGVMAFLGVVLNLSFMFSGSAGVNPAFAIVGLLLVLAWRNAGWYGLDRWVLPASAPLVPRRAVRPPGRRRRRGADHLIAAANPRRTPTHRVGVLPGWTATCT